MCSKTTVKRPSRFGGFLSRFTRADDGAVLIWIAVLLPVLVGFTALAVDAAYLYAFKSRAQAAADSAALAAVYIVDGSTDGEVEDRGEAAAQANIPTSTGVEIESTTIAIGEWNCSGVTYPDSCFTDNSERTAVEAVVTLQENDTTGLALFFAQALGFARQGVGATAVANLIGGGPPDDCIVALEQDNKQAFAMTGNAGVMNLTNCGVHVNSAGTEGPGGAATEIAANGGNADINFISKDCNASTTPPCSAGNEIVGSASDFNSNGTVSQGPNSTFSDCVDDVNNCVAEIPNENIPTIDDPFGDLRPLDDLSNTVMTDAAGTDLSDPLTSDYDSNGDEIGACHHGTTGYATTVVSADTTLYPGVYCGGIRVTGGANVTFQPGVYVMENGSFEAAGTGDLSGTGVAFVLHNPDCVNDGDSGSTGNCGVSMSGSGDDYHFNLAGGGAYDFTAPSSGNFAGFVFYDAPDRPHCDSPTEFEAGTNCDNTVHTFSGNTGLTFKGAGSAPYSAIVFNGYINSGTTTVDQECSLVVSGEFQYNGGGGESLNFGSAGCANLYNGTPLVTDDVYALVE